MRRPAVGEEIAVVFRSVARVGEESAVNPGLFLGRVIEHPQEDDFLAYLVDARCPPTISHIRWDADALVWMDETFYQPIESVFFPLSGEVKTLLAETEESLAGDAAGEGLAGESRFQQLRLNFLFAGFERSWFDEPDSAVVYFSEDVLKNQLGVFSWMTQDLGEFRVTEERIVLDWPVVGRNPGDCVVSLGRQTDGTFRHRSSIFGDELRCRLEHRDGYDLLLGFWSSSTFEYFFGAVLPRLVPAA